MRVRFELHITDRKRSDASKIIREKFKPTYIRRNAKTITLDTELPLEDIYKFLEENRDYIIEKFKLIGVLVTFPNPDDDLKYTIKSFGNDTRYQNIYNCRLDNNFYKINETGAIAVAEFIEANKGRIL
jgi:hypothetical protein